MGLARRRRGDVEYFEAVHADWHLQPAGSSRLSEMAQKRASLDEGCVQGSSQLNLGTADAPAPPL